jgi:hypothetical protein
MDSPIVGREVSPNHRGGFESGIEKQVEVLREVKRFVIGVENCKSVEGFKALRRWLYFRRKFELRINFCKL